MSMYSRTSSKNIRLTKTRATTFHAVRSEQMAKFRKQRTDDKGRETTPKTENSGQEHRNPIQIDLSNEDRSNKLRSQPR